MRSFIHVILWLVLVGTSVNKAIEMSSGNVGLAVVLAIVFIVVGTLVLGLALAVLWYILDKMSRWFSDHTY